MIVGCSKKDDAAGGDGGSGGGACGSGSTDPKCQVPSDSNAGTVGTGPTFSVGGLSDDIRGGYLSGEKLIVAVEYNSQTDDAGAILEVDLATGNRTLISGKRNSETTKGTGALKIGGVEITDLGYISDVKPTPEGKMIALVTKGSTDRLLLIEVDPATGDRTLLWASDFASDVAQKGVETMVTADKLCENIAGGKYPKPGSDSMAIGPDGTVYLAMENNPLGSGKGLVKLKAPDWKRTWVSRATTGNAIGSGWDMLTGVNHSLTFVDGKVWMVNDLNETLFHIDVNNGNRTRVSSSASDGVGTGDKLGTIALAFQGTTTAWTAGTFARSTFYLAKADLANGNRTAVDAVSGPLAGNVNDDSPHIWIRPSASTLLIDWDNAIHVFEPSNGSSTLLSH